MTKIKYRVVLPEGGGHNGQAEYTRTCNREYARVVLFQREGKWYFYRWAGTVALGEAALRQALKKGEVAVMVTPEVVRQARDGEQEG